MKVVIVGIPGAGKSSLLKYAERVDRKNVGDKIVVLHEPVDNWSREENGDLLGKFCRDPSKYIYPFQIKVLNDMLERDADIRRGRSQYTVLCERDAYSCLEVFVTLGIVNGYMVQESKDVLLNMCHVQRGVDLLPDVYVYVKISPNVALERIRRRNRPGEYERYGQNDAKYLRQLHDRHEVLFATTGYAWNVPIFELDGMDQVEQSYENLIAHLFSRKQT
jgi:deoxyadenosine/deoxycytidine kinase